MFGSLLRKGLNKIIDSTVSDPEVRGALKVGTSIAGVLVGAATLNPVDAIACCLPDGSDDPVPDWAYPPGKMDAGRTLWGDRW